MTSDPEAFVREATPGELGRIVLVDGEAKRGAKKGARTTEYIDPVQRPLGRVFSSVGGHRPSLEWEAR